jgi:hypothetical protein
MQYKVKHQFFCWLIIFCSMSGNANAQQITGVWSGKISRSTPHYRGVEDVEVLVYQYGKQINGYCFVFKDTSRFVLYNIDGFRTKRGKTFYIQETGSAIYVLPSNFEPCQKNFELRYYKIGKTQYLSGIWSGTGKDTSCFPGEELLIVLQKIQSLDQKPQRFVANSFMDKIRKGNFVDYIYQKYYKKYGFPADEPEAVAEQTPPADKTVLPDKISADSLPANRKLDIQQILTLPDTAVKITLYDNAVVDDDTVSVFVNKQPVLLKQRISAMPLSFNVTLTEPGQPIEIIMQAENLGSIPPNTAVMIIETAHKRYEVRLSAGFEKHAVVIITYNSE